MRMLKSICAASLLSLAAISVASCSSNSNEDEIPADGLTRIRVTMNPLNTRLGYIDQASLPVGRKTTLFESYRIMATRVRSLRWPKEQAHQSVLLLGQPLKWAMVHIRCYFQVRFNR